MTLIDTPQMAEDYRRIEQAIRYIEANARHQPELNEVAAQVGLSEFHFQRLFTRWAGISPKRFLQYLTKENAKQLLAQSINLLEAIYDAGLSSPGRLPLSPVGMLREAQPLGGLPKSWHRNRVERDNWKIKKAPKRPSVTTQA